MNQIYKIIPYYSERRVKVHLKEDVLFWKTQAKEYIPPLPEKISKDTLMQISLVFHGNFLTKKATIRVIDLPNLEKVAIDTIAEKLGFNDSQVFQKNTKKINSEEGSVKVELVLLPKESNHLFGMP